MRWSTSQSPESYFSRVNQKSYVRRAPAAARRSRGEQRRQRAAALSSAEDTAARVMRRTSRAPSGQTASDSEVKVKSRSFIGGIIITNGIRRRDTRTGLPSSSMLLSMITGDSLKRKFFIGCLISPFSM